MTRKLTDEELAYWRRDMSAMDGEDMSDVLDALIALRAAPVISEEERRALEWARDMLSSGIPIVPEHKRDAAAMTLQRLLLEVLQ